jgi:hypothetical protein
MKYRFCPHPARAEGSGGVRANHSNAAISFDRINQMIIRAGATNKVRAKIIVAIVLGTANSLINTRFSTPNTITDIIPKPI